MRKTPLVLSALVAGLWIETLPGVAGQEAPASPPPQTQTAPASPPEPAAPPASAGPSAPLPSDDEIEAAVQGALERDAQISGRADLKVHCDEGILTLSGKTDTLDILRQAARRAGEVRGVRDVVTTAGISTQGAPDSQILLEIQRALDIPAFRADAISVGVEAGRVRLTGTTATYARKLLADTGAAAVEGVVEITNNLRVVAPPEGDDTELARRIRLLLIGGLTPVPGAFEVTVKSGAAVLRGRVPLFAHRIQAERLALSVGGVSTVENRLKVDPTLSAPPGPTVPPP